MIIAILLLWLSLLGILLYASYRAFRRHKKLEGMLLLIAAGLVIIFTGEYALFFAWSLGCSAGMMGECLM